MSLERESQLRVERERATCMSRASSLSLKSNKYCIFVGAVPEGHVTRPVYVTRHGTRCDKRPRLVYERLVYERLVYERLVYVTRPVCVTRHATPTLVISIVL